MRLRCSLLAGFCCLLYVQLPLAFGQVGDVAFEAIPIDESLEEDAGLAAYLKPYREGVEAFSSEVIGYAAEPLGRARPESGLSNLVADSLRVVGAREFGEDVDLAISNFGGLRRDLPQGPVTMGLLTELSPFQNWLTYLEVDGAAVLQIAEWTQGGVAVSGLETRFDAEGNLLEATVGGVPVSAGKTYRMVTIDYLVNTWTDAFKKEWIKRKRVSNKLIQRDAIVLYLSELNRQGIRIRDSGEGRVRIEK